MPSTPCPGAGNDCSGVSTAAIRSTRPSRIRPAAASMIASYSPASSFLSRVSRLPRRLLTTSSGRQARKLTSRRRLEVPTTALTGSSARSEKRLETKASQGFSRDDMAARTNPSGRSIGRSFIECTARSARPSCIATSSSLMNRPLPPTAANGRSSIWSPLVVIPRMSTVCCGQNSIRRLRTCSACHIARRDSREAMTIRARSGFAGFKAGFL